MLVSHLLFQNESFAQAKAEGEDIKQPVVSAKHREIVLAKLTPEVHQIFNEVVKKERDEAAAQRMIAAMFNPAALANAHSCRLHRSAPKKRNANP